jgi:hypothetical protein
MKRYNVDVDCGDGKGLQRILEADNALGAVISVAQSPSLSGMEVVAISVSEIPFHRRVFRDRRGPRLLDDHEMFQRIVLAIAGRSIIVSPEKAIQDALDFWQAYRHHNIGRSAVSE